MSRDLPTSPNLEFLRKQAKHRLTVLQRENPALQLSDAQHALAREYGFPSWPTLKAHVESLPMRPTDATRSASPFAGTWMANVARSRQHPLNPFRSATMHIDVDGDRVTITDVVVDSQGRSEQRENTFQADGIEHPSPAGNGYSLTVTQRGARVLETLGKKDGEVIGRGTYEVDPEGGILTITGEDQLIVLERLAPSA